MKKISEEGICCDNCFEKIGKLSGRAARLWTDICKFYPKYGLLRVPSKKNPIIKDLLLLEQLGFLVTHETRDDLIVKMSGYHTSQCNYFCIGDCDERMCQM